MVVVRADLPGPAWPPRAARSSRCVRPRPCGTSWTCSSSEGITGPRRSRAKLVPLSGMSSFRRH